MDTGHLVETLQSRGFYLSLVDDKLRVSGCQEPDDDTKALLHEVREQRHAIIAHLQQADPLLTLDNWYPEFQRFHRKVVLETPSFDYVRARQQQPELYKRIKAKEAELDALQEARLSKVMTIMHEWRELILRAEKEVAVAA
jgi:hypothetical protein